MDGSPQLSKISLDDDAAQVLDYGSRALKLLSMRVELAKVEARRAELEQILLQAKGGEVGPLRRWLNANRDFLALDVPSSPVQPHTDWVESSGNRPSQDRLLPTGQSSNSPVQTAVLPDKVSWQDWEAIRKLSLKRLAQHFEQQEAESGLPGAKAESENSTPSQLGSVERPKKLPIENGLSAIKRRERDHLRPSSPRQWRNRGVTISAAAHLLLILGLALVTIQVPMGQGILEFQASASSEKTLDSLEMVEPLHSAEPMETLDQQSPQWSPVFENALPDLPTIDSALLGDSAAVEFSNDAASQTLSKLTGELSKQATVNFYGAAAAGNCFCFLIDGSATMRGAPWEAARAELIRTLQSLSENQRFYVIFYNRTVNRIPDPESGRPARMALYASRENLQHAIRWLQTQRVEATIPGGNQTTVLQAAIELEPDAVFYLTDGEMTESVQRNVLDLLRRMNRVSDLVEGQVVRIPINTIAFHSASGVEIMRRIADENRGQSTFVPPPKN